MLDRALELAREPGRGELRECRAMARVDPAHELGEAAAVQGRDAADRAERREREAAPRVRAQRGAGPPFPVDPTC